MKQLISKSRRYDKVADYAADENCKTALLRLRKFTKDRLRRHDHVMQAQWGFDMPVGGASYEASPAATKYTDFVLATAAGKLPRHQGPGFISCSQMDKQPLYTVAAVAPFVRLLVFIASEIKGVLDPADKSNPYCKWIEINSCRSFQIRASEREVLLGKRGDDLDIERVYHHALKLLVEFIFDSALPIPQKDVAPVSRVLDFTNHQLTIFCDFDKACAVHDSSAKLKDISINNVPRNKSQGSLDQLSSDDIKSHASETQLDQLSSADIESDGSVTQNVQFSSEDIKTSWDIISKKYMEELEQCKETILTSEKVDGFRYEDLCSALEQIGAFEGKANERVVHSGLLKDDLNDSSVCSNDLADENLTTTGDCSYSFVHSNKLVNKESISSGDLSDSIVQSNELASEATITAVDLIDSAHSSVCSNELADENLTTTEDLNDSTHSNESTNEELIATGYLSDSNIHSNKLVNKESVSTEDRSDSIVQSNELAIENLSDFTIHSNQCRTFDMHSNKLPYVELITTGEIIRKLETPLGRLQIFHRIQAAHREDLEKDNSHLAIYIGGWVGDFLCLLQADIGIVINGSSALRSIGDHFGITFAPLFSALVKKQRQLAASEEGSSLWKPMSGTLYTVSNWAEIDAFILGGGTSLTFQVVARPCIESLWPYCF